MAAGYRCSRKYFRLSFNKTLIKTTFCNGDHKWTPQWQWKCTQEATVVVFFVIVEITRGKKTTILLNDSSHFQSVLTFTGKLLSSNRAKVFCVYGLRAWRPGGKGKKIWKRGFPWRRKAQSFSCETQYPWLNPKHGAIHARLPSKGNREYLPSFTSTGVLLQVRHA